MALPESRSLGIGTSLRFTPLVFTSFAFAQDKRDKQGKPLSCAFPSPWLGTSRASPSLPLRVNGTGGARAQVSKLAGLDALDEKLQTDSAWCMVTGQLSKEKSMLNRKSLIPAVVVPLIVGLLGLMNLMNRPRFASYHNVDVLQLLVSGMCFGVALAMLIALLRGPRNS